MRMEVVEEEFARSNITDHKKGYPYREAKDVGSDSRLFFTANKKWAIGVRYSLREKVFFTLQTRYTGDRALPYTEFNEPGSPWQVVNHPTLIAPGYVTADLALYFPKLMKGLDLTVRAVNLFDKDCYNAGREVLYSLPSRSIFLKLGYNF